MRNRIARLFFASTLLASTLALSAGPHPAAARTHYFTLVNTGTESWQTLAYFRMSPSYASSFGPDLLGNGYLYPGTWVEVAYDPDAARTCYYDLEFEGVDGSLSYLWDQPLCATSTVYY